MPKVITNKEFLHAALRGARYEDGSPVRRYVPPATEPELPPPPKELPPMVIQQLPMDLQPLIDAIEAIKIEMPKRAPMAYTFNITGRDSSGKVDSFTVTESPING